VELSAFGPVAFETDPFAFYPPPPPSIGGGEREDDGLGDWPFPDFDFYGSGLDVASYNSLIAGSEWEDAMRLLRDMRGEGISPDATSYRYALEACSRAARNNEAWELIEEMWRRNVDPDVPCYVAAISACRRAKDFESAGELLREMTDWGERPDLTRFHTTPRLAWDRDMRRSGCSVRNVLGWNGRGRLPDPPQGLPCWLLPAQEETAIAIAEHRAELRRVGWKVLSSAPEVVSRLGNKASFRDLARELGLEAALPKHYDDPESAEYPCVIKPAVGTWGKDTHIVYYAEECRRHGGDNVGSQYVLQELISGRMEYSTSLLCNNGEILDAVCTRYEYNREQYVWPNDVEEVGHDYVSVPAEHMDLMRRFLGGFSGVCNFNYKLRYDGAMCIFEVNPRVGGDLAFEVPRARARAFFEKLDSMFP